MEVATEVLMVQNPSFFRIRPLFRLFRLGMPDLWFPYDHEVEDARSGRRMCDEYHSMSGTACVFNKRKESAKQSEINEQK
mmetsp:Transcript_3648/g.6131  ORF Transcript_3648/g.6131 Transcript_3648/m.6131 type:complete len:80 (-) Transcript_3648:665-904(-)